MQTAKDAKYTGKMEEGTRKTVRNASKAAMVVGGLGMVSGANTVGTVLSGAGLAGAIMTSDRDYQSELTFKCL